MAAIGKVSAVFTASTSGLTAGVKAASSSFRSLESDTKGLTSSMRALVAINGAQLFGSIASSAAAGVRSLLSFAQGQADIIDNASKLAARLGMSYGDFAGLSLAADLAGVSMETVGKASQKAEIAFANAANGSKTAQADFARLGLSIEQLGQMSAAERFDAIAAALARMPDEAQRAAAAVEIFGEMGGELLPLFAGGAEGIAQAREQAERLGLALTTAQGQDVEAMNDSFTMVSKTIEGVVQQVTAYLAPAVKAVSDTFVSFVGTIGGANIGRAIGDAIITGAVFLAGVADVAVAGLTGAFSQSSASASQWRDTFSFINGVGSFLAAGARLFQMAFLAGVRIFITPFSNILEQVLNLASLIPGIGDTARVMSAAVSGFRQGIDASLQSSTNAFLANANAMISTAPQAGSAMAGPISASLEAAIEKARKASEKINYGPPLPNMAPPSPQPPAAGLPGGQPVPVPVQIQRVDIQEPVVVGVAEAIKGIDSRSSAGAAEMFRLMRGSSDTGQKQVDLLTEIAAHTREFGVSMVEGF